MQGTRRQTRGEATAIRVKPTAALTDGECATSAVQEVVAAVGYEPPPLKLRWSDAAGLRPVPTRAIRPLVRRRHPDLHPILEPALAQVPLLNATPLHFSQRIQSLCADIAARCSAFANIDA